MGKNLSAFAQKTPYVMELNAWMLRYGEMSLVDMKAEELQL